MAKRGETKEIILNAATKVFMKNGFEATSVKMIIEEAGVVTGSFYYFFESKEALFEAVIEKYLQGYTNKVSSALQDEMLTVTELIQQLMIELKAAFAMYYEVLEGNKLHWTLQYSLHDKTLEALTIPMADMLKRYEKQGMIKKLIELDDETLAMLLLKGSEAIIHGQKGISSSELLQNSILIKLMDFWKRLIEF